MCCAVRVDLLRTVHPQDAVGDEPAWSEREDKRDRRGDGGEISGNIVAVSSSQAMARPDPRSGEPVKANRNPSVVPSRPTSVASSRLSRKARSVLAWRNAVTAEPRSSVPFSVTTRSPSITRRAARTAPGAAPRISARIAGTARIDRPFATIHSRRH